MSLARGVEYREIPRDDVAAVLLALLDAGRTSEVLELVSGDTPVHEAVAALRDMPRERTPGDRPGHPGLRAALRPRLPGPRRRRHARLLDTPSTGAVLEVVAGYTPVDEAVAAVL